MITYKFVINKESKNSKVYIYIAQEGVNASQASASIAGCTIMTVISMSSLTHKVMLFSLHTGARFKFPPEMSQSLYLPKVLQKEQILKP